MSSNPECDRARLELMAWLDGETGGRSPAEEPHLATCTSCQSWLADAQAMTARFEGIEYPGPRVDVWAAIENQLQPAPQRSRLPAVVWLIVPAVLAWRAFQLSIDVPWPALHPIVPLMLTALVLWQITVNPLAIATSAPELEKRGI